MEDEDIRNALRGCDLPFGVAVCLVDLVDCLKVYRTIYDGLSGRTFRSIRTYAGKEEITSTDEPFGDFSPGRFAWKLEKARKLHPFAVKGSQGLFDVPMPGEFPT